MTGQQREFAVGDRVIRRYAASKYGAGTVFEIVPYYRIEWDNGFEPAVYSPEELDPAPCPPLAVGDPFTAWMAGGSPTTFRSGPQRWTPWKNWMDT